MKKLVITIILFLFLTGCARQPNPLLGKWMDKAHNTVWEFQKSGILLMTSQDSLNGVTVKYHLMDEKLIELTFFAETSNPIHGQATYKINEDRLSIEFTDMGALSGTKFNLKKIVEDQ